VVFDNLNGVPDFICDEFSPGKAKYCLLIPVINENKRLQKELKRAKDAGIHELVDIIICDGGSTDGCVSAEELQSLGVNTLLTKTGYGKQSAQLRMGFWWALERGYEGFVTIDGNNKDSIEDVPSFTDKLDRGYDFVQGSRFIKGGKAVNTPFMRYAAVRLVHAPVISFTAGERFTDTTNAFRAFSRRYITHPDVQPFRDIFVTYELLAYLSVMASRIGLKTCEIPVKREYPKNEKTPTKIKGFHGNSLLLKILFENARGKYGV
jgi:dolichol-phosphate mannosyltransferase